MPVLAETIDAVVGGDTHRDTHTLVMCAPSGVVLSTVTIANSDAGYRQALDWITDQAPGPRVVMSLEGTRSYGVGLARAAKDHGLRIVEAGQPRRADRRSRGKSDPIDARLAATSALTMQTDRLPVPRADGAREALRILLTARRQMTTTQTALTNRLRALQLTGDEADRGLARASLTVTQLRTIARRRGPRDQRVDARVRRAEARRLALAILSGRDELADNREHLHELVNDTAPSLLTLTGVGPVSAAQLIVSWSHPGRCRNDAAFAALAGACPIPASSGRIQRHRLNRGGDRDLNRALHDILLTRWRICPRTHAYIAKRRSEGRTDAEIRRCLKRYLAREIHRELTAALA